LVAAIIGLAALLLLLPIRLFEIGTPEWRPLGWIHTASVATLTLLYIWSAGGKPWLRHFAFPIAFFFVAVPWVTPIEGPIIQGLMRAVARVAAETVTLFGIPTQLEGNLIRVSSGLVGVNEACSGVRSLQTTLMIGLLFGELKRLSILRRVVLVAGAIAIALTANFCRAIFLVWIAATENISQVSRWHNLAGYAIVALVFVGTLGLAYLLGRKKPSDAVVAGVPPATMEQLQPTRLPLQILVAPWSFPTSYFVFAFCWIVAVELGAHLWYRAHESNLVTTIGWNVRWPEAAPNFRELKIDEEVRRQLRFDQGHAGSWTWPAASSQPHRISRAPKRLLVFYIFSGGTPAETARFWPTYTGQMSVCLRSAGTRWRTQGYAIIRLPARLLCHFAISNFVVTHLIILASRLHTRSIACGKTVRRAVLVLTRNCHKWRRPIHHGRATSAFVRSSKGGDI